MPPQARSWPSRSSVSDPFRMPDPSPPDSSRDPSGRSAIPVFVNPAAGNAAAVDAAIGGAGGFERFPLDSTRLRDAIRAALDDGAPRICVAGGDGSVATAAAAVVEARGELAIIPAGTLNHLAKALSIPLDPAEALRVAGGSRTVALDVGFVNDRLFVGTSSVGAYATFVRARERLERRLGYWLASAIAAIRILMRLRTVTVTIEVDGVSRTYRTPLVFIGVGERELRLPTLGARVEGGRSGLHVIVVRSRTGARIIALALAAAARGLRAVARTPALDAFVVDRCTITGSFHAIAVDGEVVRATSPLEYRLERGALRVVVP